MVVTINGVRFGFVSLGDRKMDANVFAGPDYPGIANLTPENLQHSHEPGAQNGRRGDRLAALGQ